MVDLDTRCDACGNVSPSVRWVLVRGAYRFTMCRPCRVRHAALPETPDSEPLAVFA